MAFGASLGAFAATRSLPARQMTFADAVAAHQDELFGATLRILGDRDAALEATNNAFFKAYRAFDRYDRSRPLRHWLLRIATNEAITLARARSRELRRRADADAAATVADPAAAPLEASVAREERERIRAAVAGLPELYRVVIVLRYFSELSVDEIAGVTGRPASTVGVQLLRGRALLRAALGEGDR